MTEADAAGHAAAFFDVDGTLTSGSTLFRFLAYRFAAEGRPPHAYRHERQRLRAMTEAGVPRTVTNSAYFASYAGLEEAYVAELAREWFRTEQSHGGFCCDTTVAALRGHEAAGERIVLVSGSFPALLEPLGAVLGADALLATEPEMAHGRYTGRAQRPMIGDAKAQAARSWAQAHGIDLAVSTAYGDHYSDVPLLETTGSAVIVGGSQALRERARHMGWQRLPPPPPAPPLRFPPRPALASRMPSAVTSIRARP